jgi:hypothetical protein
VSEQVPERDGAPARRQVQISQPVDGVLGDCRPAREVGPLQVIVKVYVADQWRQGGTLLDQVEVKGPRREGRVSYVEATAEDDPEVLGSDFHEIRPGSLQEREILGEPTYAFRV